MSGSKEHLALINENDVINLERDNRKQWRPSTKYLLARKAKRFIAKQGVLFGMCISACREMALITQAARCTNALREYNLLPSFSQFVASFLVGGLALIIFEL